MPTNLVLFNGIDAKGFHSLWVTDGTPAGTWEISANSSLNPFYFATLGNEVLLADANENLWITDGTSPGTTKLSVAGNPRVTNLAAFGGNKALFEGDLKDLWVTDGTSAGTSKLTVSGANTFDGLNLSHVTAFSGGALFAGLDSNFHEGLWVTDGTSANTTELTVANAWSTGVFAFGSSNFAVLGSEALFRDADAA